MPHERVTADVVALPACVGPGLLVEEREQLVVAAGELAAISSTDAVSAVIVMVMGLDDSCWSVRVVPAMAPSIVFDALVTATPLMVTDASRASWALVAENPIPVPPVSALPTVKPLAAPVSLPVNTSW